MCWREIELEEDLGRWDRHGKQGGHCWCGDRKCVKRFPSPTFRVSYSCRRKMTLQHIRRIHERHVHWKSWLGGIFRIGRWTSFKTWWNYFTSTSYQMIHWTHRYEGWRLKSDSLFIAEYYSHKFPIREDSDFSNQTNWILRTSTKVLSSYGWQLEMRNWQQKP